MSTSAPTYTIGTENPIYTPEGAPWQPPFMGGGYSQMVNPAPTPPGASPQMTAATDAWKARMATPGGYAPLTPPAPSFPATGMPGMGQLLTPQAPMQPQGNNIDAMRNALMSWFQGIQQRMQAPQQSALPPQIQAAIPPYLRGGR